MVLISLFSLLSLILFLITKIRPMCANEITYGISQLKYLGSRFLFTWKILIYVILISVSLAYPSTGFACSMVDPPKLDIMKEFENSDSVFQGKVKQIYYLTLRGGSLFLFQVDKSWKGVKTKEIYVEGGMCGNNFSQEKEYLVFATGTGPSVIATKNIYINKALMPDGRSNELRSPPLQLHKNVIPIKLEFFISKLWPIAIVALSAWALISLILYLSRKNKTNP